MPLSPEKIRELLEIQRVRQLRRSKSPWLYAGNLKLMEADKLAEVYAQHEAKRDERREKERARGMARYARKMGRLKKPTKCEKCGNPAKLEMHHEDYLKPLEVTWLCVPCHYKFHPNKQNPS